jgi:hypothetical protein
MDNSNIIIKATLRGIRPILFDRYAGDTKTKLPAIEKFYTNEKGQCVIPVLNVFSLLSAQNTPSVAKRFWGKQGRDMALGINSSLNIESDQEQDPMNAPIMDDNDEPFTPDDKRIQIVNHVARLKDGVPNPKERPLIPKPWHIRLKFELSQNEHVSIENFKKMLEQGGILGLGTFRPIFGRYTVEWVK